jgi:putative phosphoribosyl transferase
MATATQFRDRRDAGQRLATALAAYANRPDALVLALPRGGVPVGYEVATALNLPLDIFLVRKLGVPGQRELAMGAIAEGGACVIDHRLVEILGIPESLIGEVIQEETLELKRRARLYRGSSLPLSVKGREVILVDDGLATGSTMRAALDALRIQRPGKMVVAVPVAPAETCDALRPAVDELYCLARPGSFNAVGEWYEDFRQVTDDEVQALLGRARRRELTPAGERTVAANSRTP